MTSIQKNKKSNTNNKMNTIIKDKRSMSVKKKKKIPNDQFRILKYNEYRKLDEWNYNVSQLKQICKNYKLKVSGNKNELFNRVYTYLKNSLSCIKIQKLLRGFLLRKYLKMLGPALLLCNRSNCVNDCDFYTLDPIKEIPFYHFFSFKDEDGFIYGFDFCSLYNLIRNSTNGVQNPFNRKKMPSHISKSITYLIHKATMYGYNINIELDNDQSNTNNQSNNSTINPSTHLQTIIIDEPYIRQKILSLFQKFDQLGFYTDLDWVLSLSATQLIQFVRQLKDIWIYRANLSQDMKYTICPPYGNPFLTTYSLSTNMYPTTDQELLISKFCILEIGENLIKSMDSSNQWLGASYFLTALTLVNTNAAEAMPWLYEAGYSNNLVG